jgi:hypothetical protein
VADPTPDSGVSTPLVLPDGGLAIVDVDDVPQFPVHPSPTDTTSEPTTLADQLARGAGASRIALWVDPTAGTTRTGQPLLFTQEHTAGILETLGVRQQRTGTGNGFYTAAVDPTTGQLYVAWGDSRLRTDSGNDVVITTSTDAGTTWTYPQRVNPGPENDNVDRYDPTLAVGGDGTVYIAYRQRQEAAGTAADGHTFSTEIDTMLQMSTDHATTFGPPLQVNQQANDVRFAAVSCCAALTDQTAYPFLGDYLGLAVSGKDVYVARTDPIDVNPGEAATFPPSYHHQRLYVADVRLTGPDQ